MRIHLSTIYDRQHFILTRHISSYWYEGLETASELRQSTQYHGRYPYGHKLCPNHYSDYLSQCRAYKFAPLDLETWQGWRMQAKK